MLNTNDWYALWAIPLCMGKRHVWQRLTSTHPNIYFQEKWQNELQELWRFQPNLHHCMDFPYTNSYLVCSNAKSVYYTKPGVFQTGQKLHWSNIYTTSSIRVLMQVPAPNRSILPWLPCCFWLSQSRVTEGNNKTWWHVSQAQEF